jgi:PPP family 3-phenylpropionic acid transporter
MFSLFERSIEPISDAITLEYVEKTNWNFGRIRVAGTLGFATSAVLAGIVANYNMYGLFIMFFTVSLVLFIITLKLPKVKGHQSGGNKVSISAILKNKKIILYLSLSLIIQITVGFYNSFFSIYFKQIGANNLQLGYAVFIATLSEIPFLTFADKILGKFKTHNVLLFSGLVAAVRWLLMYFFDQPNLIMVIQVMHGLTFIVFVFSMAVLINNEVPKELRGSGQTLNMLISISIAPIIGSAIGGLLSDVVGIKKVFLYNSILAFITVISFLTIFLVANRKEGYNSIHFE